MPMEIEAFRMPRYREIPDVGLYLDQTVKYINRRLAPLECLDITSSMVSNYVKKGYIASPQRKQYSADQIACLFFITIAKSVLSMENIDQLLRRQEQRYTRQEAYDYFCAELEYRLADCFGLPDAVRPEVRRPSEEQCMLQSVVIAVVQIIYLSKQFEVWKLNQAEADAPAQGDGSEQPR